MVNFYHLESPANKVDKQITLIQSKELKLRKDFDFNNPFLILNRKNIDPETFNYVFIENRYYFVTKITRLSNTLVRVELEPDYLMNYKDLILNNQVHIKATTKPANAGVNLPVLKSYVNHRYDSNVTITPNDNFVLSTTGK